MTRRGFALAAGAFAMLAGVAPAARAEEPSAEAIFSRAKGAWRTRTEAPFVAFALRERYVWRDRVHDNWWQGAYRDSDRALALRRVVVPAQEEARLRGMPIHLNLRMHGGAARADSLDTNADADAFPILEPLIEPNASFGLLARDVRARLSDAPELAPIPRATAAPASTAPDPAGSPAEPGALRELGRVEAVARDYAIALAGVESVHDVTAYHLVLTPLRDPRVYRLRDLWVEPVTFRTVQLAVQGLFDGKPYDDARWLVGYVEAGGRNYVQQIRTEDTLKFGLDRFVGGLEFDFVQYDFPESIPDYTFRRLL
jgi:hypothetical protein